MQFSWIQRSVCVYTMLVQSAVGQTATMLVQSAVVQTATMLVQSAVVQIATMLVQSAVVQTATNFSVFLLDNHIFLPETIYVGNIRRCVNTRLISWLLLTNSTLSKRTNWLKLETWKLHCKLISRNGLLYLYCTVEAACRNIILMKQF